MSCLFLNNTGNHTEGVNCIQMLKTKLSSSRQMQRPACLGLSGRYLVPHQSIAPPALHSRQCTNSCVSDSPVLQSGKFIYMPALVVAFMSDMSQMSCTNVMLEEFSNATVDREMFLKNYTAAWHVGVHRVAVFDAHGAITCIVSQLDVMRSAAPSLWHPLHLVYGPE